MIKKALLALVLLVVVVIGGGCAFFFSKMSAYDKAMATVYDVPVPEVERTDDPDLLARGEHIAHGIGGCTGCHGEDLADGKLEDMGPVGRFKPPNITPVEGGVMSSYTDGELVRLLRHGIKKDGTSVFFMPVHEMNWWPEQDVVALVSYLRTIPAVEGGAPISEVGPLGKFLDRQDAMILNVAERIDHDSLPTAPEPAPTKEYGAFLAIGCTGCHGETLSGGPIPGAPPSLPIPSNLTTHDTGLADYAFEDFERVLVEGIKKDGSELDPFMPVVNTKNFSDVEKQALWAYLQSIPAKEFGNR